jgi:hypothetical protein
MSLTQLIRFRAATVAVVVGLAGGALAVPVAEVATGTATAAHAASARIGRSTQSNADPVKVVEVPCPGDTTPYVGGGAVDYGPAGNTGVALTSIVPDQALRAVVVTATAPPGQTSDWALVGYAICTTQGDPDVVIRSGLGAAVATCPGGDTLFGVGFHVAGDPAVGHVTGIDLNAQVAGVLVTAGGPGAASTQVTAVAVCQTETAPPRMVHAVNDDLGWPKLVVRQDHDSQGKPYATGAKVTGPEAATLDAVVPASDGGVSWARGTLYGGSAPQPLVGSADGEGDDGSVSLETSLIGTFH